MSTEGSGIQNRRGGRHHREGNSRNREERDSKKDERRVDCHRQPAGDSYNKSSKRKKVLPIYDLKSRSQLPPPITPRRFNNVVRDGLGQHICCREKRKFAIQTPQQGVLTPGSEKGVKDNLGPLAKSPISSPILRGVFTRNCSYDKYFKATMI